MITEQSDMPATLDALRLAIDEEMNRSITHLEQQGPEHDHALIQRVYRWMRHYLASDGKRMHGIAVALAYQACSGERSQAIIPVAAALQIYHHHTLVHDDIYDEDSARRGWPTSHLAFASLFHDRHHAPVQHDAASFLFSDEALRRGTITAFAYGKICRAMAGYAMLRSDFPAEARLDVATSLDWHDLYDNIAQLKDVYHEGDAMYSPDACLSNAWLKTGRLFEVCAYTGARLANAQPEQITALKTWAGQSAIAYQLQDDLEDLNIDSEKGQGRGIGTDLLRCKPTYLYALAKTLASDADLADLLRWQAGEKAGLDTTKIITILERCGAVAECRQEVDRCLERASTALQQVQPGFNVQACAAMSAFSRYFASPAYWHRHIVNDLTRSATLIA
jgi:geranylgeranyl diphosphate synthase type I